MIAELDRARDALQSIPCPEDREAWWPIIGSALAEGIGEDELMRWCENGPGFDHAGALQTIRSLARRPRTGQTGSLFALARAEGWRPPENGHDKTRQKPQEPLKPRPKAQSPAFDFRTVWDASEPATAEHPYIARKLGLPDGLRVYRGAMTLAGQALDGALLVPVHDAAGARQSWQAIPPEGDKRSAPGAPIRGGRFIVGGPVEDSTYLVEGIGQAWSAHQATGMPAVCCFGAGNVDAIARDLRERHPKARLVIVADAGKEADAERIAAAIGGAWVGMPEGSPANHDLNDYHQETGSLEAVAELLANAREPEKVEPRFKMLTADDILAMPTGEDLIRGVLPRSGLGAMFSPSGSGKSFLILDMVGALQSGDPWFGRRTRAVPCTYVVLEGQAGLRKRVQAYQAVKGPLHGVAFMVEPFAIIEPDQVDGLADRIIEAGNANGLVVIDTLSRAAGGVDENGPEGMGRILAGAGRLQHRLGGLVLLVHHTGKDAAKGLRGHSSLVGALDAAIEVNRDGDDREWTIAKNKDDRDGEGHLCTLRVVELGTDDDGEPITSCVVHPMMGTAEAKKKPTLPTGGNQRIAYQAIGAALRKAGDARPEGAPDALPAGRPVLTLDAAIDIVGDRLAVDSKRKRERAMLALTGLVNRGLIVIQGGHLWAA